MIVSFKDRGSEAVFHGRDTRSSRKTCPRPLWPLAQRKLDQLNRISNLYDLRIPPGNHLEQLRGKRAGQYSIRINDQYRICFKWKAGNAYEIEITDYH